jgi:LEA14-like dessication related protein
MPIPRHACLPLIASLGLAACAFTPKFEAPKLTVVDAQLGSGDLFSQQLKVRMHVVNPNDRALPVRALEYTLEVDGQQLASGVSASSFVVPALGETDFDMNVTTNLAGTLLKLIARGSQGTADAVPYHLSGKVSLSEGLLRSIPFDQSGTFKLQ